MNNPLSRRSFIAASTASVASVAIAQTPNRYGPHANPTRYPEPDVIAIDKRFAKYKVGNTPIQRLYTGMLWAEGPAWNAVGKYLLWSDIPNNVQMRYLWDDGHVSVFRNPSNYSNGNTFDWEGRQIAFEHDTRRVVRYEHSGKVTVLTDKFTGKPYNAPNDGAVHPDGSVWFTDPGYGIGGFYEGHPDKLELKEAVYRIDKSGKVEKLLDDMFRPNGLCFSPDYKKVYIADTGASHYENAPKNIRMYDLDGTKVKNGREFCSMKMTIDDKEQAGFADGIRCDVDGNVWVGSGWVGAGYDGVQIFAPDGVRIGQILLPEICSNLAFGGPKRNRLFMTGSQSLYAVYVETQGAHIT